MKISTIKRKKGFTLIELLVVIAIMAALAGVGYPIITSMMVAGDRQAASDNLKQIGTALSTFKTDIKTYPSDGAAKHNRIVRVAEKHGEVTGTTSNPYFRQLFYKTKGGVSEENFYATLPNFVKGDNYTGMGETLKAGECSFSYVMRKPVATAAPKKGKRKPADGAFRPVNEGPIAMCGTIPSTTPTDLQNVGFDLEVFGGYAYAVTTDGRIITLEQDVHLKDKDGEGKLIPGKIRDIFRTDTQDYVNLSPETF